MALICVHSKDGGASHYLRAEGVSFTVTENPLMESSVPEGTWEEFSVAVYYYGALEISEAQETADEMVALLDAAGIQSFVSTGKGEVERIKF